MVFRPHKLGYRRVWRKWDWAEAGMEEVGFKECFGGYGIMRQAEGQRHFPEPQESVMWKAPGGLGGGSVVSSGSILSTNLALSGENNSWFPTGVSLR